MEKRKKSKKAVLIILLFLFVFLILPLGIFAIDYHRFKNADTIIKPIITVSDCECKCHMDRQIDGLFYCFTYTRASEEPWEESVLSGSFHFPFNTEVLIYKEYK
jgi:hypothetical protein